MQAVILFACLAVASAGYISPIATPLAAAPLPVPALGATLLPRVNINPAQVNVVKQQYVVQQPELRYRQVPVPVKAVAYTAPQVVAAAPALAYSTGVVGSPIAYNGAYGYGAGIVGSPLAYNGAYSYGAGIVGSPLAYNGAYGYGAGIVGSPVAYNGAYGYGAGIVGSPLAYNGGYVKIH